MPIERSVDSRILKPDLERERWQRERAAMHDPDKDGRSNNGGKMYSSNVIEVWRLNEALPFDL
jgi:hypothetical protein